SVTVIVRVTNTAGNGQNIVNGTVNVNGNAFSFPCASIPPGGTCDVTVDTVSDAAITGCLAYNASVTFQGANTDSCPPITTTCSGSIRVCGCPNVCITKLVKCLTTPECVAGQCGDSPDYAPSATGVEDAGFCYKITINNC